MVSSHLSNSSAGQQVSSKSPRLVGPGHANQFVPGFGIISQGLNTMRHKLRPKLKRKYSLKPGRQGPEDGQPSERLHLLLEGEDLDEPRTVDSTLLPAALCCHEDASPKLGRLPRALRLNLDLPENEDLERTVSVESIGPENEDDRSLVKCPSTGLRNSCPEPRVQLVPLAGYGRLPNSGSFRPSPSPQPGWPDPPSHMIHVTSGEDCRAFLASEAKLDACCIDIEDEDLPKVNGLPKETRVDLPVILNSSEDKFLTESRTTESDVDEAQIHAERESLWKRCAEYAEKLKEALVQVTRFCQWFAVKFATLMKKGYKGLRNLMPVSAGTTDPSPPAECDLSQVIAAMKCANDRLLSVISHQVSSLSQEMNQVKISNQTALSRLTSEMEALRATSDQLLQTNTSLAEELKLLQEKSSATKPSAEPRATSYSVPAASCAGPPPPPPPPPPPMPPTFLFSAPKPLDIGKPKAGNDKTADDTPKNKYQTPFADRPPITVEDLLKVTLKKSSQNPKEKNTVAGPRGPIISLDMLRNVKLRSAASRRRSFDQRKSPRCLGKSRSQSTNQSLSPQLMSAESSLLRLLKPVSGEPAGRGIKRAQSARGSGIGELRTRGYLDCELDSVFV